MDPSSQAFSGWVKTRAWIIAASPAFNDLKSNREFVNAHLSNVDEFRDRLILCASMTSPAISCFALNGMVKLDDISLPHRFQSIDCVFAGNSDGLVCVVFGNQFPVVLNPILKTWTIPSYLEFPIAVEEATVSYGFGKTVDGIYKILRLSENSRDERNKVREVAAFSYSSRSWSVNSITCPNNLCHMHNGYCIDGCLHFLCYKISNSEEGNESCVITSINLSDLSDRELSLPPSCSAKKQYFLYLCDLHDRLGLVEQTENEARRIWGRQHDTDRTTWVIMFNIQPEIWGFPRGYLPSRNELIMVEETIEDGNVGVFLLGENNIPRLERKINTDADVDSCIDTTVASLVSP